jgi:hypothetical protein
MHIRCIAHVINLVVQALLAAMDEADDPAVVDYFTLHRDAPIHYNIDEDQDQAALEAEGVDNDAMEIDDEEPEPFGHGDDETSQLSPLKRVSF